MTGQREPTRWKDDPRMREAVELLRAVDEPQPLSLRPRVWRRLWQPKRSRIGLPLFAAAAAATAVVATLVLVVDPTLLGPSSVAQIAHLDGEVFVGASGGALAKAQPGQQLASGAQLQTSAGGEALIQLQEIGEVLLDPSSGVQVGESKNASLRLQSGSLVAFVKPRKRRAPFRVVAGPYEVRVIGTVFKVARPAAAQVDVRVHRGVVVVDGPNGTVRLRAGESFSSRGAPVPPIPERALRLGGLLPAEPTSNAVDPDELETSTPPDEEAFKNRKHRRRAQRRDTQSAAEEEDALYAEATATKDVERAIELYDQIAARKGPRAQLAAYQAARLTMKVRTQEAADRFSRMLKQRPRTAFDAEARLSLIECRMQLEQLRSAEREIETFLRLHPNNERLPEIRFLRGELSRRLHNDCRAALEDYRAASDSARVREDALYFSAWCLLRVGEREVGKKMLEQYLRTYPGGKHAEQAREGLKTREPVEPRP